MTDDVQSRFQSCSAQAARCFHCGEPCPDRRFRQEERIFCCHGCLVVHDLLAESGLEHFYNLESHPGARADGNASREQWKCLDEPALQQKLLDFTDGRISRVTFKVPTIHCVACVWLLENLFRLNPALGKTQVNFSRREVTINFAADKLQLSELVALLASIGYEPSLNLGELDKSKPDATCKRRWLQIGVAGFAFGNIMLFSLPAYLGLDGFDEPRLRILFGSFSLILALPVLLYSAADYWKSALLSLRQRTITLDIPIALGLAALYSQSAFDIVSGKGAGYLDSLAGLVLFLLCGRVFQQKTYERLSFDRDYKSFFPLSVTRTAGNRRGGALTEECVSVSQIEVGDRIRIRNAELIPADARLLSGRALVDYSFVSGEAEPVAKAEGDYLYAGGRQIGSAIEAEIVKPVSESYLTSLWNHEAFRKCRENDLNTLTNRYSRHFTIAVVGVAVAAASFWLFSGQTERALRAFTAVLIVACPCALALAAPFAFGTVQRLLAGFGVFLKNAQVVEQMADVNAIVFDKTGTLTSLRESAVSFASRIADFQVGANPSPLKRAELEVGAPIEQSTASTKEPLTSAEAGLVFSLARHSTHPHAMRICEALQNKSPLAGTESFSETPGCGIAGRVEGHEILLGSKSWFELKGVAVEWPISDSPPNGSVVCLAIDGQFRGAFVISTQLRGDVRELIGNLSPNYELALLSGDNEREREQFQDIFGTDAELNFNRTPLDKLGFIRRLQDSGKTVMMVGDGLNDAGALKQSDVGVAVVEKIGAFSPASDAILEAARIPQLDKLLRLSRKTVAVVRFSLAISAIYNLAGVSLAAAGVLSPLVCAILMPLSSISVVLFACGMTAHATRRVFGVNARRSELPSPLNRGAGVSPGRFGSHRRDARATTCRPGSVPGETGKLIRPATEGATA